MKILIPMAGAGSRFAKEGYTFPKPLIDVRGKPMIQSVVENLDFDCKYIFLVRKEQIYAEGHHGNGHKNKSHGFPIRYKDVEIRHRSVFCKWETRPNPRGYQEIHAKPQPGGKDNRCNGQCIGVTAM